MALTIKDTAQVMLEGNKGAFKESAKRRTGKLMNDRLAAIIVPKLPAMIRMSGFAETPMGRAVLANTLAGAIIHFGYKHEKLTLAADAMVTAAMDDLIGSFDLEGMVNDLIDGVDLSPLETRAGEAGDAAKTVLRRAAGGEE